MIDCVSSRKNTVRNGGASGSTSSGSLMYSSCSKRFFGLKPAPRAGGFPPEFTSIVTARKCARQTRLRQTKICRFVARAPFDIAAEARFLIRIDRLAGEHGIDRCAQIRAGRRVLARTRAVELSAINEPSIFIEKKKIRRACSRVGFGD